MLIKLLCVLFFILLCGVCGYAYEYIRYCARFYKKYRAKVFKRGFTYLERLWQ